MHKLEVRDPPQSAASPAQLPQAPRAVSTDLPYEQRTVARVGNVGWDTPAKTLVERAQGLVRDAQVPIESHGPIVAAVGRKATGSACEIVFKTPADVQDARVRVDHLHRAFGDDPEKCAWLDAKTTKEEFALGAKLRKLRETVSDLEDARPDKQRVAVRYGPRAIRVGDQLVCWIADAGLEWTDWAQTRYTDDQRRHARVAAEIF